MTGDSWTPPQLWGVRALNQETRMQQQNSLIFWGDTVYHLDSDSSLAWSRQLLSLSSGVGHIDRTGVEISALGFGSARLGRIC